MKKNIILCICILILIVICVIIGLNLANKNNGEYYITDNERLYDIAIDYIREEEYQSNNPDADKDSYQFFITYDRFGITEKGKYKYAYMWILGEGYYLEDGKQKSSHGYSMFFKFTFENDKVVKYENPEDGSGYVNSIKKMCIDKTMSDKIINYDSKLSNKESVKTYYSKVTNSANLEKKDIMNENGLIFNISWKKTDCIPVSLSVYDNGKYELATDYETCKPGVSCNMMLKYTKKETDKYDYDVMKIIQNSIIADNMTFTNDKLPEYEIYTGDGKIVYMMITDSNNKYLNEFLKSININLHTCANPEYK